MENERITKSGSRFLRDLDDLLAEEKFIIQQAIKRSGKMNADRDCAIPLISVVNAYCISNDISNKEKETAYKKFRMMARSLMNINLATIKKENDGLIWIYVSRSALNILVTENRYKAEILRMKKEIENISRKHELASFLTLTVNTNDPETVPESWEKFKTWLAEQNGGTIPEIVVTHEFSPKGYRYIHALVAVDRIADRRDITTAAVECGFGPIVSVHGLDFRKSANLSGLLADVFTDLIPGVA